MGNRLLILSAVSGFICVAFGAFAAHGLELTLQQADWIDKGWRYQSFHTVALLALGFYVSATAQNAPACRKSAVNIIGIFWALGIVLFSFTLYFMALSGNKNVVMLVPMGGIAFLIGWLTLLFIAIRNSFTQK
ncbi:uncharacterized membrane protein YgdD (TMEM256/DUF423 family) [Cricetibacter osteomyelitidis]|uniref:Uncharacterized membrane protein YgdD (TMEM256/DUF423 family) n=1 Tax=Cricetibacter osteomyelitidis TaxID=1521931 RepID=A0A4V2T1G4_9PAST|nr:DUF423 domain-containing protein [Cricetibacter osteomyelitidis]TCP93543.1 uncharacterized membrane protein YgdD (TMEM256/DUF423 family) [Cricetibacter osteomyelitidis]